jgi:hypothetical protein
MKIEWAPLLTHLGLFALLVICSTVVYNGLRRENVGEIVRIGLRRSAYYVTFGIVVFGLGLLLVAEWL